MKKYIINNALLLSFVIPQIVMLFFANNEVDEIDNININEALSYHILVLFLFIIGYFFSKLIFPLKIKHEEKTIICTNKTKRICYFLITIGIITSISTTLVLVGFQTYFSLLINGDLEILQLRYESSVGGLSGIFKMFNYAPLAVYLCVSAFLIFFNMPNKSSRSLKKIQRYALIGSILKVFFILDRLTILAIFIVFFFQILNKRNLLTLKNIIIAAVGIIILVFVTSIRMGSGINYFLSLYSKLGLVNLQLVMDTQRNFSYNFANTFLSPFDMIADFFNINRLPNYEIVSYQWNPAQYFNSYLYQDFGYFSILIYPLMGFFTFLIERKKTRGKIFFTGMYFFLIFVFVTFITVPFIRTVEFWLVIIIIYSISRTVKSNNHVQKINFNYNKIKQSQV